MKPVILVIEDSKTHLKVITSLLEEFGYAVLYAENDLEALQFAKNHKPDLILLDLSLPGIGGLEVCRNLSQDHETGQIPIFILTQKTKIEDKIAAFKAGVRDYLTRPYHPEELRARIQTVLKVKEHFKVLEKDKKRLEEQMETIQDAASRDSLTELLSRRRFLNSLKIEFIRSIRYHLPLTLCAFDIDRFRMVNSQFGELSGDIVLAGIADLIKENFREIDFHSRIDQDHFLACLPQSSPEDSMVPLNRFHKQVSQLAFESVPKECRVTMSIGVSFLPNPNITDENHLLDTANRALLRAKELGGNKISVWDITSERLL